MTAKESVMSIMVKDSPNVPEPSDKVSGSLIISF